MLKKVFNKLINACVSRLSPEMQKWLTDTLLRIAKWIYNSFSVFFKKWFPWLSGGSVAAYVGTSTATNLFDTAVQKFGIIADLIQIDLLFSKIDSYLATTSWSTSCNMSFTNFMSALGVISNINSLLNCIGLTILWAIAFWVFKCLFALSTSILSAIK